MEFEAAEYPAITVKQPWASWIAGGAKTIETRTHNRFRSLVGQWVAIHAGNSWDKAAMSEAWDSGAVIPWCSFPLGAVVGLAHVREHRLLTEDDTCAAMRAAEGLWGLVFDEAREEGPHRSRGYQGIWRWRRGRNVPQGCRCDGPAVASSMSGAVPPGCPLGGDR